MHQLRLTTPAGATEIVVGELLSSRLQALELEPILLIDKNVLVQYHDIFEPFRSVIIPSGESNKTLQTVEAIYRELVTIEADRSTLMVGVGGGLATDVAGFRGLYLSERNTIWLYQHHAVGSGGCQYWGKEWCEPGWL